MAKSKRKIVKKKRYFGTDGIRGKVGVPPISADWALKLGWALGRVLMESQASEPKKLRVLIGKDTRISGYMFESALEAGLCAAGVNPGLLGPMPTPAIPCLIASLDAQAGIVISASHNRYTDNGFKFFSAAGTKFSDEMEYAIEKKLGEPMTTVSAVELGKAFRVVDAVSRYRQFCTSTLTGPLDLSGYKIVVDCAHGATYHIAPALFRQWGAEILELNVKPDGLNINEACGATNLKGLQAKVLETKADLGLAFDGDGDRLMMVDQTGAVVDGDELLFILAKWYQMRGSLTSGGIVGTAMSNFGLEKACIEANIPFYRAQVGDRYVLEAMQSCGAMLGGESSGHLICLDASTTGDGIISALRILESLQAQNKPLHELKLGMTKYPQVLINVPIRDNVSLEEVRIKTAVAAAEAYLKDSGRVLLRSSGTEPVVRVMVEGQDAEKVAELAKNLAETVQQVAGMTAAEGAANVGMIDLGLASSAL